MNKVFEEWKNKYYNKIIVDYSKYFTEEDITLLHKLEVNIELDKIYTEYQHECFEMDIIAFYEDAENIDGTKEPPIKNIDNYGVSREDYKRLLDILYQVSIDYNF